MSATRRWGAAMGLACALAAAQASAVSDCCVEGGRLGAGCDDPSCEGTVCGMDSSCCSTDWHAGCGEIALRYCELCERTAVDDFLCHKVKRNEEGPKFPEMTGTVRDQFQERTYTAPKPMAICNPATVDGDTPRLPEEHLESYKLRREPGQEKNVKFKGVRVEDRFGLIYVDTLKPDRALLLTGKRLGRPPDFLNTAQTENFICWKVRPTRGTKKFRSDLQVTIVDQFEQEALFDVKRPTRLCAPILNDSTVNPEDHLMCYQIKRAKGEPRYEKVSSIYTDVVGVEILDSKKEQELCVEAAKQLPES